MIKLRDILLEMSRISDEERMKIIWDTGFKNELANDIEKYLVEFTLKPETTIQTELGINYNDLKEYPKFLTKNITRLMLTNNNIESIDYIPENLEMLNFEHNKISSI
jgi:Leucine-rich repeat (LRR) protein